MGPAWSPPNSSPSQPPGRSHATLAPHHLGQHVGAVDPSVEGEAWLERLDVTRQQPSASVGT